MHKKLQEIIIKKKQDLRISKKKSENFLRALKNSNKKSLSIIAEIKLHSPFVGNLGKSDDIENRVKKYAEAGANCISIITEKHFFKGDLKFLQRIKYIVSLPILQKDFIIDPFQIYEAKTFGADAILLIARIVSQKQLISLVDLANEIGIEPVVEINNNKDLKKAINTKTKIIAMNARDLDTFKVDVDKACTLLKKVPKQFIKLGFSGVHSSLEVEKYRKAGASTILVGTELMKTNDISSFIKELKNVS